MKNNNEILAGVQCFGTTPSTLREPQGTKFRSLRPSKRTIKRIHCTPGLAIGLTVILMVGCGHASMEERAPSIKEMEMITATADSTAVAMVSEKESVSSSAATAFKDTARKFIRTADLRFKVKDVRTATYRIEDVVRRFDGFVTYTHLESRTDYRLLIPVSADSSLESTYYTVVNNMSIRVPNAQLDTVLKGMAHLIDYLDHRTIKADDISLSLLANSLAQKRNTEHGARLKNAIEDRGRKLNETSTAEDKLLNTQTRNDEATLANLDLQDKIAYSTITLDLYQRQSVKREMIGNDKNIEAYKPGFLQQVKESILTGWQVFEVIFLFIVKMWGVILISIVIFFGVRSFLGKRRKQ